MADGESKAEDPADWASHYEEASRRRRSRGLRRRHDTDPLRAIRRREAAWFWFLGGVGVVVALLAALVAR
jgi:hypothetical protein